MVSHPYLTRSLTRFFFTVLWWTRRTRIFFGVQHFFKGRYGIAPLFDPFSHPFFFSRFCAGPAEPVFFLACSTFFKDGMVPHPYLTRSLTRWTGLFFVRSLFLRTVWYRTRIWPVLSPVFFSRFCAGPAEPVFFLACSTFFKDGMVSHPYLTRSLTRFFFTVLWWTRWTRFFLRVLHFV